MLDFILIEEESIGTVEEFNPYNLGEMCSYTGRNVRTPVLKYCSCSIHRNERDRLRHGLRSANSNFLFNPVFNIIKSDSYETLQIEPPITEDQLKKAYKKMSLKTHPDKPSGSTDQFIKVNEAYNELLLIC
tara:strand:- start:816 stop:1208 length:393 start_codon:yes stop_codon:yes gene_type:complete